MGVGREGAGITTWRVDVQIGQHDAIEAGKHVHLVVGDGGMAEPRDVTGEAGGRQTVPPVTD